MGIAWDQIIGRPISDVIGQSALEAIRPHFEKALSGEKVEYQEKVFFKGIGERWIRAIYTPTFGPNQIADGWVAVVIDVRQRTPRAGQIWRVQQFAAQTP
jgi:PAS domain S-box-containing protein